MPSSFWRDAVLPWLARELVEIMPPRRPLRVNVAQIHSGVLNVLKYKLLLPPAGAPDVVRRELSVFVNGSAEAVQVIAATSATELTFADNDNVTLVLVDIDDAGNRSIPSPSFSFVATDTIAPPAPGAPGVELVGEV